MQTQRDVFWNKVYDLAAKDRNVMVVSADMGAPALDRFRRDFPGQFVNVGIAEQNAILIASGLAMRGKRVFVYAIAPFITLRCLEQIRVECSIMDIAITIVGVGAGFGYSDSGPTHHIIEDVSIMRSMPNIQILTVSDSVMAGAVAEQTSKHTRYVRLDRQPLPSIYKDKSANYFAAGVAAHGDGAEVVIIASGYMVHTALKVVAALSVKGVSARVVDVFRIPIAPLQFGAVIPAGDVRFVTLEEHFLYGGLVGAVSEVLSDAEILNLGIGMSDGYSFVYGGREEILKSYGLDYQSVLKRIVDYIAVGE